MNISPNEAEEALASIQKMTDKTRHSIAGSGASITLIATGIVWMGGFIATQFLTGEIVAYIWIGLSLLGSALAIVMGIRMDRRVRSPSTSVYVKRFGIFWLLLIFYAIAVIAITRPTDGKQMTMVIVLFIMIGQLAMGLPFSFTTVWWVLPVTILALVGYFLVPNYFYLWMGLLVGGTMIALGLYIRYRW